MSGAEICGTGLAATWAGPRSVSGSRRGSHRMMTGWFRRSIHDSHRCHFSRSVTNRRSLHPPWKRSTYISTTSASLPVWAPSPSALDGGTYVFARPVAWHQDAQILSQTSMADGQSIVELPSSAFGEVKRYLTSVKFTIWFVLCCIYTEWKNILYPYMRTYIQTYIHTDIHTYLRTYIHTYIHTNIQTYIHTYRHTYIHTYVRTYIHTNIQTNIQTYIHTYIQTDIHTYIYATKIKWHRIQPARHKRKHTANFLNPMGEGTAQDTSPAEAESWPWWRYMGDVYRTWDTR